MKNAALAFALLVLAGMCMFLASCAQTPPPEPTVVTKEAKVAVAARCKTDMGVRPALMNKDQIEAAVLAAPTTDDKAKIITDQLLLYIGWTPVVEAGLKGCAGTAQ